MSYAPVTKEVIRELSAVVGEARLSTEESDRSTYGRDMWPRLLIATQYGGVPAKRPHVVVWPQSTREVAAVVRIAHNHRIAVVPYGGGSGVCGGVVPVCGGITVDLKRMETIHSVKKEALAVDVDAGINGERFERELGSQGLTLGHFPSSIYCSTVGGWLACRAAGQMSTKYGKIEDMVIGLTVVTGRGEIIRTDSLARSSRGPNWTQLLVGSEGTLGIITRARLRVRPSPQIRVFRGFEFESLADGVTAIRRVMQRDLRPAVVRLYDSVDTFINNSSILKSTSSSPAHASIAPSNPPGGGALPSLPNRWPANNAAKRVPKGFAGLPSFLRKAVTKTALSNPKLLNTIAGRVSGSACKMIVGLEGARARTEIESRLVFSELVHAGATDLGEEPGHEWLSKRYDVSYKMSQVFREGAFVDTMEVAATWERLSDLYYAVSEAIANHAVVMAHFSHAYPDGCSIYFTFAARGETREESQQVYDAIWRDGLEAASRVGGTISHHHGIGLLKSRFMATEHRESMRILTAVKRTLDPAGIMNPGKLGIPVGAQA